jgi:hypothetical protein
MLTEDFGGLAYGTVRLSIDLNRLALPETYLMAAGGLSSTNKDRCVPLQSTLKGVPMTAIFWIQQWTINSGACAYSRVISFFLERMMHRENWLRSRGR